MSLDFATVFALVVSLAIRVFFVFTLRATEKRTERKIREVAHQAALIGSDDLARDLCRAVRKQIRARGRSDFTISEDGAASTSTPGTCPDRAGQTRVDHIDSAA